MARVEKRLKDVDETDGDSLGHYSREDMLALCHATEGGGHE